MLPRSVVAFLSLGSNQGDRVALLARARAAVVCDSLTLLRQSSLYETAPQDFLPQPWFLNQVVKCETNFSPKQLLAHLLQIERDGGRVRSADAPSRGPRTLDLDILLFGESIVSSPELEVPHPRLTQRRFVLEPLLEIDPDLIDPRTGCKLSEYLPQLQVQQLHRFQQQ